MADPFPEVMRALSSMRRNLVLDGELVIPIRPGGPTSKRFGAATCFNARG